MKTWFDWFCTSLAMFAFAYIAIVLIAAFIR